MPSPPQPQDRQAASHLRDSWPPTQLRLHKDASRSKEQIHDTTEEEDDRNIDPLVYFLSPTPTLHPADSDPDFDMDMDMDMDMDLDIFSAGIIDASHPPPTVRSISPSSLTGLALPPPHPIPTKPILVRPPTPPRTPPSRLASPEDLLFSSSPSSVSDDEEFAFSNYYQRAAHVDDGEDYIRLGGVGAAGGMLRAAVPWMRDSSSVRARRARAAAAAAAAAAVASAPTATRGRTSARFGPAGQSAAGGLGAAGRGRTSGRRSPRAWREPSPEVWDIEEETEEDVMGGEVGREMRVEKKKAGGKRVRFVLPDREAYM